MPESDRHHRRNEHHHKQRERDHSNDGDHPMYERRDREKERENKRDRRDDRYQQERGPGSDQEDRPRDRSTRWDPREDTHHQGHQGVYTDTSMSTDDHYEPQHREALYNLRYIGTSRGICQAMEVFLNMLIVICAGVSHSTAGRYRDLASLGGLYYYYFGGANAFTGAEADRVKELDELFYQLKLPPYIFSMACGGALMGYACAMLVLGVLRVPFRWPPVLLAEALLNALIGLGYLPAVAFYFIKLQETYNHPICKEREKLYKSKNHQGFECSLHGADIAGGLFGVLGVILFLIGAVLAIRAFRAVRERKKQREVEDGNFERGPQSAPND